MLIRRCVLLAGLGVLLGLASLFAADAPSGPAYQIVLRSRCAEATPTRCKDAQTGGGTILVEQPEPNTIVISMTGAAVAGSDCVGACAGIDFNLEQDLEIIPARRKARPPLVGMVARVMGTLQVAKPCKCSKTCGTAEQGPATACLSLGGANLLTVTVQPSTVACGQESSINHRDGPCECPATEGCYHLSASFRIAANQSKGVFNRQYAVADFDPAPELDAAWANALRPFRAVPRRDFGFKVVVRVIEDPAAEVSIPK